jgi:iron-sulfur cluster assembly protein
MFDITDSAKDKIKNTLAENQADGAVRIFLADGGCSGPQLALALDEVKDNDNVYEIDGQTYLVDEKLSEVCGEVKVDFVNDDIREGFIISTERPFAEGGGCGSCGCGCG